MNFPLYDTLEKKVTKSSDIKPIEKRNCIDIITSLDENGKEILVILIYLYYKNNNNKNETEQVIPYDGSYVQKNNNIDIEWNINKFPVKLKRILYEFLKMHINSMDINKQKENLS
jgi:hypothetical protein